MNNGSYTLPEGHKIIAGPQGEGDLVEAPANYEAPLTEEDLVQDGAGRRLTVGECEDLAAEEARLEGLLEDYVSNAVAQDEAMEALKDQIVALNEQVEARDRALALFIDAEIEAALDRIPRTSGDWDRREVLTDLLPVTK